MMRKARILAWSTQLGVPSSLFCQQPLHRQQLEPMMIANSDAPDHIVASCAFCPFFCTLCSHARCMSPCAFADLGQVKGTRSIAERAARNGRGEGHADACAEVVAASQARQSM